MLSIGGKREHGSQGIGIGIVGFNVPLDTLQVISETILQVRWPNQQSWLTNVTNRQTDIQTDHATPFVAIGRSSYCWDTA